MVLILGIWASVSNQTFLVNRLGKLSLALGWVGMFYSMIISFTGLGDPNIDKALKGEMLAGGLGIALTYVAFGATVFAVLAAWDFFKQKSAEAPAVQA